VWSAQVKSRKAQVEFDDTWKKIRGRESSHHRLRQFAKYAAVALVLLNLGWWGAHSYYNRSNDTGEQQFLIAADQTANSVITLPDHTQVYLRKGSSLRYGSGFRSDNREVLLEGEAYFEVARDENHPFIVKMEHAHIQVFGTRFNVSAEKGSSVYQTTLVDGEVTFQVNGGEKYQLQPDQMIEFDVNNQRVKIENVNTELYTAWKDGKIIFRDETLGEITRKLERIYDVKFIYKNPELAQKYRFSGTFHRETSIGEVIIMLKLSIPMEVKREERFPDPDKIYLK
jgi:ferric-dicitrate binding protein FerR (iron transport regulator)